MVVGGITIILPVGRHDPSISYRLCAVRPSVLTRNPLRCCSSSSSGRVVSARADSRGIRPTELDEELRFSISDFAVSDRVSIGLHGRGDEEIFEATVSNPESPLYNSRVVLRQLTSLQAQRRGRRALQALKKLARRQLMYYSYAMQVHGYVSQSNSKGENDSFILIHEYHGSYSLRHWLQLSDWFPTLEGMLALDEEGVKRVGDDSISGPAVTRQLRLIRILMRDLLIGVNYLHTHGLAHTELRLENVHISPVDKHVKVGILGNAVDFEATSVSSSSVNENADRRKLMIAFDMRCVGFILVKMILRELMDPSTFGRFKNFLTQGNDPSCLREFLLTSLCQDSSSGNLGLQMLNRSWGAGWNLLSLLLAIKPSERISCLDALRHPFLCGPRWRVSPSMDVIRWGLGSTAVQMAEDYIYVRHQRSRIAYFIELMELLNPNPRIKDWMDLLSGQWRLLYSTGKHIGLTLRQPSSRVLINNAYLTFIPMDLDAGTFLLHSIISFKVMPIPQWPHDKSGIPGNLNIKSSIRLGSGRRFYLPEQINSLQNSHSQVSAVKKLHSKEWNKMNIAKKLPFGLPAAKLVSSEAEIVLNIESPHSHVDSAKNVLQEVRTQVPPEMFDVSKLVCGTYVDARMMVLRGVNGSALLFTRSPPVQGI